MSELGFCRFYVGDILMHTHAKEICARYIRVFVWRWRRQNPVFSEFTVRHILALEFDDKTFDDNQTIGRETKKKKYISVS